MRLKIGARVRLYFAIVIGIVSVKTPAPASTRTRMISSVAYADDEMLSEAKTASPLKMFSRSCGSAAACRSTTTHRMPQALRL